MVVQDLHLASAALLVASLQSPEYIKVLGAFVGAEARLLKHLCGIHRRLLRLKSPRIASL